MLNREAYIKAHNCSVDGVNTHRRAQGLKHFFLGKGNFLLNKIQILQNINFESKQGDKIAFIGSNGSGKSSFLKVIAGIYPTSSGSINVKGRIGASIEMGFGLEYEMTGRQNIKLMMVYNDMLDQYNKDVEEEIIGFSELKEKIDWPVKIYSSGMLSRLAFSVSLANTPEILLLDEVFSTGDQHFVKKSVKVMSEKFLNTPISILVSHQESLVKELCSKVYLFKQGKIIEEGNPDEVFKIFNKENPA
jgi:lipopolysaccharide transport system ATP-binding protein